MWDLPGPGLEPMSPALAGGFLTTAPSGKPYDMFYTNPMVTTKNKSRAKTQNIKKEESEENIIKNHQSKMADRNTRKKRNNEDIEQPENKR